MIKIVNLIIPTYKARDTLPTALDSLVAQTKKLFIITIVQDADDEDYTDIIQEYRRRGLQIKLLQMPENGGPGLARQYGMDHDTMCDYFMFMDSDDILMPRAIELLYREAKLNDADFVSSDFIAEQIHAPGLYMDVTKTPITWTHGKLYKAKYLRDNNIRFHPSLRLNEDAYFNLVAGNCTKNKIKIQEVTYLWRENKKSLTRSISEVDFFKRSWEDYIVSQVQGLIDIDNIINYLDPNLVAATLLNIYNHCMRVISLGNDLLNTNAPVQLEKLATITSFVEAVHTEQFWSYIYNNLKACDMFNNNLIFFKQRFCDWMKEYIVEDLL